jgi:hypothetical protein
MRRIGSLLAILLLMPSMACAPKRDAAVLSTGMPGTSAIRGTVKDLEGHPLQGAMVRIEGPALSGVRITTTDKEGYYSIYQLPSGDQYKITVEPVGYPKVVRPHLRLPPFTTMDLPFATGWNDCFLLQVVPPMLDYTVVGGQSVFINDGRTGEVEPK